MLWVNQHQRGDYMRDQLMVGMRHLAGANMVDMVDWVKVPSASGYSPNLCSAAVRRLLRAYICT